MLPKTWSRLGLASAAANETCLWQAWGGRLLHNCPPVRSPMQTPHCDWRDRPVQPRALDAPHGLARLSVLLPRVEAPEGPAGALPRPLAVKGHDSEDRRLDVGYERGSAVHRRSANRETVRKGLRVHGIGHVDHKVELAAFQHGEHVRLALHKRLVDHLAGAQAALRLQHLGRSLCGVELEAHVREHPRVLQELDLLLRGADADEHGLRGQLEAGSDHGLQEGLVLVGTEACDLAGGLHLDAQPRVRVLQPAEGEDGDLCCDAVHVDGLDGDRTLGDAEHDPRRQLDEVHIVRL
mmetsp:Transcript_16241/g.51032  ORF Transcript_16241/g.51032 Transcript_16241/m.51032 type:complete len:294 (-) Transcript_16241:4168-5049(-)